MNGQLTPEDVAVGAAAPSAACGLGQRILQLHPTLRCNLQCAHCYSNSGPAAHVDLDGAVLCGVISDAAALGYAVVAVSGGEPLLYPGLALVLQHAKACGLRTTVTTNGTLLSPERLRPLVGCVDTLAISLDGPPTLHNQIRQSPRAFERLVAGLEHVRSAGFTFGFIHTLTSASWEDLLWTADFAAQQGAALLQLHPLERTGRAATQMPGGVPDDASLARAYLLTAVLAAKYAGAMAIQLDVFNTDELREQPELVYAGELPGHWRSRPAAELLGLIVVEADGAVVPISYGFGKRYHLGNLRQASLAMAWPQYVHRGYPAFRQLCQELFQAEIAIPAAIPLLNWHERIVTYSQT
jgi:MoaA/NifB/PqqE/SkfB family radical SAM enzyme